VSESAPENGALGFPRLGAVGEFAPRLHEKTGRSLLFFALA